MQTATPLQPVRIEVFHYRAAIIEPIITSFGSIPARNALLLRMEDREGAFGWGEVWANFPPSGAESKVQLLEMIIIPMTLGRSWATPAAALIDLTGRFALTDAPGLGVTPDAVEAKSFLLHHSEHRT